MQLTFDHIWYRPGDNVRMLTTVSELPSGDSPGGVLAAQGEELIVRRVSDIDDILRFGFSREMPVLVSHHHTTDNCFRVASTEIQPC